MTPEREQAIAQSVLDARAQLAAFLHRVLQGASDEAREWVRAAGVDPAHLGQAAPLNYEIDDYLRALRRLGYDTRIQVGRPRAGVSAKIKVIVGELAA